MSNTNDFLSFGTDPSANVQTQSVYAAEAQRPIGQQPGIAKSALNNKALRQASAIISQLADIAKDRLAQDIKDDGNLATLKSQLNLAFPSFSGLLAPTVQRFLSSSGTYNKSFIFNVTSATVTAGAVYTDGANSFTVKKTISSGTTLTTTSANTPAAVSGTLTKTSGTGDATITYLAYQTPLYIKVKMCAGGGGGGSGGVSSGGGGAGAYLEFMVSNPANTYAYGVGAGGTVTVAGGSTTFGGNTCTGGGAGGNVGVYTGGSGGSVSVSTLGDVIVSLSGGSGGTGDSGGGGNGGSNPFGGGAGGNGGAGAQTPAANSGGGGSGNGGTAAAGVIIVEEFYQ